jgi:hypothetical protein
MPTASDLFKSFYRSVPPLKIKYGLLFSDDKVIAQLNMIYFFQVNKFYKIYSMLDNGMVDSISDYLKYSGYFTTDEHAFLLPQDNLTIKGKVSNSRTINIEGVSLSKKHFSSNSFSICKFIARNYNFVKI